METNHGDLLNEVIREEKNVPMDESMEAKVNEGCIPIHSCTGAVYFIDPKDPGNAALFSSDNIMENISKFSEMEMSLINVMHNLLIINEFPEDEKSKYISSLIEQFTQSLNGYGIKPTYDELNKTLDVYTKAMFMAFDLFAFAKTINHFLVSMVQANMMLGGLQHNDSPYTTDLDVDLPDGNDSTKCYKVYGHIEKDNSVAIIQVTEEDTDPSEFLIVQDEHDDELDGVISLYTLSTSEEQAAIDAQIVFDGYVRNLTETEAERAIRIADEMSAPSGLLE